MQEVSSTAIIGSLTFWGIVDTPEFPLFFGREFNFFIGAGAGFNRISLDETVMNFPATYTLVPVGVRMNRVAGATVGFSQKLDGRVTLDIAWRYMDHGVMGTDRGGGEVIFRDNRRPPVPLDLAPTEASLKGGEITASVRIRF